ncbi:hypothetical protein BB561_002197 [Smittium simulii]|uniref:Mitochondrial zinc maintenance protein 1, mitochondrial n=1 Tax=Smittium simulii TaxID=133385 RepID=A0A2T9YRG2_9FUNG|nr:hypothetical protein BB561_002197 [Smittium simulii]
MCQNAEYWWIIQFELYQPKTEKLGGTINQSPQNLEKLLTIWAKLGETIDQSPQNLEELLTSLGKKAIKRSTRLFWNLLENKIKSKNWFYSIFQVSVLILVPSRMSASNTRVQVLRIYRNLLRTENMRFKGDNRTLSAAKLQTRAEFEKNRNIVDQQAINKALLEAQETEIVLRKLVVQAVEQPGKPGTFRMQLSDEHERKR